MGPSSPPGALPRRPARRPARSRAALLAAASLAVVLTTLPTPAGAAGARPRAVTTSPAPGSSVAVGALTIAGSATDDGGVAAVEVALRHPSGRFLQRSGSWSSRWARLPTSLARARSTSTTWQLAARTAVSGSHRVSVRARDVTGAQLVSATTFTATWGTPPTTPPTTAPPTTPPTTAAPTTPPPSGTRYAVGSTTLDLVDTSRGGRRLTTTVLYPAAPGTSGAGAPAAAGPFPVVIAGHGMGGSGASAANLHAFLPQHGYVVAAPTFPGTRFADMAGDISFVLSSVIARSSSGTAPLRGLVDGGRAGYIGTSLGGMAGLSLYQRALLDSRFDAVVIEAGSAPAGTYAGARAPRC